MCSSMEEFQAALSGRGLRLTAARRTVLQALISSGGHVSADELVELLHDGGSDVGRMTVYRTLDLLTSLGLVRPVYQGTGAAHYIVLVDGHHHHLVCTRCHMVVEVEACVLREIEPRIGGQGGFEVHGHLLEIYGVCRDCKRS